MILIKSKREKRIEEIRRFIKTGGNTKGWIANSLELLLSELDTLRAKNERLREAFGKLKESVQHDRMLAGRVNNALAYKMATARLLFVNQWLEGGAENDDGTI